MSLAFFPPRALCLAGPTASGKSQLALRLATDIPLTLINTDSLQLYQDLPLLTARPSSNDLIKCPHQLYGFLKPEERFSVARWLEQAEQAYLESLKQGRHPIFVGGTGLYFKALTEGITAIPPIKEPIQKEINDIYNHQGLANIYHILQEQAPEDAARLNPKDTARILRSTAVLLSTGKPLSWWHTQPPLPSFLKEKPLMVVLLPDRLTLYQKAEKRFDRMMEEGALQEVHTLLTLFKNFDTLPISKALGAKELAQMLRDTCPLSDARLKAQQATRRYIKRQFTWFRHQLKDAFVIEEEDLDAQYECLTTYLGANSGSELSK